MARSMFPFDDSYRVTFNASFLPSQNTLGEIESPTVPDPRYKVFPLDKAPQIPTWRQKSQSLSSESTTSSPSPNIISEVPQEKIQRLENAQNDETNRHSCTKKPTLQPCQLATATKSQNILL